MIRREVTGGMKRFFAAVMVLLSVVTLSGCKEVPSFMPSFWDGLTRLGAEEYVQNTLQEKYGEEFVVTSMGIHSGQYYRELVGTCSPKSDENIAFNFEVNSFGEQRELYDDYIQNVVRKQLKQNIDEVLSTHYDNFASEVYVTPLTSWYDSEIRLTSEATIKNFSESFTDNDENCTLAYIVIKNSETDFNKIENALQEMCVNFYQLNVFIDCYYTDNETIERCKGESGKLYGEIGMVDILRSGGFEKDDYVFFNDGRGLVFISNNDY